MFSTGIPWDQESEYVAACRTELQPGEDNVYIPLRHTGTSPIDMTGFQIGSAYWNIDNLPDICYLLYPPAEWRTFQRSPRPPQKKDANGKPMYERHPWPGTAARPVLDYPILRNIDTICTEVEWEWLEFIMRLDPRITWDDIDMRMEYIGARAAHDSKIDLASNGAKEQAAAAKKRFINAMQTRCQRGRLSFGMLSWRERAKKNTKNANRDAVLAKLSAEKIANNTTRGLTPGIIDPSLPDTPENRVHHRMTQIQQLTPRDVQPPVMPVQALYVQASYHQNQPRRRVNAAPPQHSALSSTLPHISQLAVPPVLPSSRPSLKRKVPSVSTADIFPVAIDLLREFNGENVSPRTKRARRGSNALNYDQTVITQQTHLVEHLPVTGIGPVSTHNTTNLQMPAIHSLSETNLEQLEKPGRKRSRATSDDYFCMSEENEDLGLPLAKRARLSSGNAKDPTLELNRASTNLAFGVPADLYSSINDNHPPAEASNHPLHPQKRFHVEAFGYASIGRHTISNEYTEAGPPCKARQFIDNPFSNVESTLSPMVHERPEPSIGHHDSTSTPYIYYEGDHTETAFPTQIAGQFDAQFTDENWARFIDEHWEEFVNFHPDNDAWMPAFQDGSTQAFDDSA